MDDETANNMNTNKSDEDPIRQNVAVPVDDDEEDADIRRALALSLMEVESEPKDIVLDETGVSVLQKSALIPRTNIATSDTLPIQGILTQDMDSCSIDISPYTSESIVEFHRIMWDPTLTTEADQQRWLRQGIDVQQINSHPNPLSKQQQEKGFVDTTKSSSMTENTNLTGKTTTTPAGTLSVSGTNYTPPETAKSQSHQTPEQNEMILLDELATSHLPWGLVQEHGGPCGVLAAIQAELLRLLLFNPNVNSLQCQNNNGSNTGDNLTSSQSIQAALAGAIAYILARSALTPSAVSSNDSQPTSIETVKENVNVPQTPNEDIDKDINPNVNENINSTPIQPVGTVKIILPNHSINSITNNALDWDDLQPWLSGDVNARHASTSSLSNLQTYSIRSGKNIASATIKESRNDDSSTCNVVDDDLENNNDCDNDMDDASSTAKRQKVTSRNRISQQLQTQSMEASYTKNGVKNLKYEETVSNDDGDDDDNDDNSPLQIQIQALANSVQQFLLSPLHAYNKTCSSAIGRIRPLDYFRHNGGVLLLVMSIAATRGISVVREEFDDVTGCRLTSNFGHCSQELINIFLTGQAVSNVFDNTLTPVGMVCRGIQSRPMIGYLTQLEAMRYCEVGSYYKSPKVPIWVVGSTSHFTVLFGHRIALKESQSDILLDQCRQAFKSVDAEENGFIGTNQLSDVFQNLEITIKRKKRKSKENNTSNNNENAPAIDIDSAKIQALSAALEVTGADIILWDDFWKATSRLLMGASFESVILKINNNTSDNLSDDDPICLGSRNTTPTTVLNADYDSSTKRNTSETNYLGNNHEEYNNDDDIAIMPPLLISNDVTAFGGDDSMVGETDEQMARRLQREWEQESSTTATTITTVTTSASTATTAGGGGKEGAVARVGSPMDIDSPHHQYHHNDIAASASATTAQNSSYAAAASSGLVLSDEEFARLLQAEWDAEAASGIDGETGTVSTPTSGFGGYGGDASSVVALSGSPSHDQSGSGTYNQHPVTPPRTIGVNPMNMSTVAEEVGILDMDHDMMDSLKPAARQSTINSAETEKRKSNVNLSKNDPIDNSAVSNVGERIDFEKYGDSFKLYHYNGLRGGVLTSFELTRLSADEAVGSSIALRRSGTGSGGGGLGTGASSTMNDGGGNIVINIAQDLEDVVRTKWPSCVLQWPKFSELASID
jgi:Domain of unknown function (DUF4205)